GTCAPKGGTAGCLGPGNFDSRDLVGRRKESAVAGDYGGPGFRVPGRPGTGLGRTAQSRPFWFYKPPQFLCISFYGRAGCASCGSYDRAVLGTELFLAAQAPGGSAHCGRYHRVVLAFYGGTVDLYLLAPGVGAMNCRARKGHEVTRRGPFVLLRDLCG